ncbi:uncharacterized protein L201_007579 [Kwoniella dendrophila CBS 6074]|uniref:Cell division control protein 14 n=1 Tax=Kwoniella dendrophila CBS 6074 TaxID=1295534 RepID=A0AAX4K4U0_9TREE
MSRPQGHRKSQSTSALSYLASQSSSSSSSSTSSVSDQALPLSSSAASRSKESKYRSRQSHLPSVRENGNSAESVSASMANGLPGVTCIHSGSEGMRRTRSNQSSTSTSTSISIRNRDKSKSHSAAEIIKREKERAQNQNQNEIVGMISMKREKSQVSEDGLEDWLSDLKSLRSSSRRRLSTLRNIERYLVESCLQKDEARSEDLISKQLHQTLLSLLIRHTSSLSQRSSHTSLPAKDDLAFSLIPEIEVIASILQGLCCLSRKCKETVGEGWVMEMFIDLLLLLRAQPAITENSKAIAYTILEMLFCVLVDSPKNARTYEKLGGLEAVVRVLKGTGVTKDVRMKCIEFLYFYLLPEQNEPQRVVSSSSTSSSSSHSSNESSLFPPSPLSSQNTIELPKINSNSNDGRLSPTSNGHPKEFADIDMPFVPMTPRKAPQPNLGYLTPSTRKTSICTSSGSSTPGLPTVPASPRVPISQSSTSRGLAQMLDEMDNSSVATPRSSKSNRSTASNEENSSVGLRLGLPKSTSGLVRSNTSQRDLTSTSTTFTDPFDSGSGRSHSGSSGSSTIVPPSSSRSLSRSNTQPSLTITDQNGLPKSPSIPLSAANGFGSIRRVSTARRVSKSPLIQSNLPENESPEKLAEPTPRTPKMRHSRTQSHLSGLPSATSSIPPVPPLPLPISTPLPTPGSDKMLRTPSSKSGRAFPAELTRGNLPSSISSPSLVSNSSGVTPLGASKRIPSDKRPPPLTTASSRKEFIKPNITKMEEKRKIKDLKSVEEKKEMLGMWLGNVDQLVQGVEKVSFWGSIGNGARGSR